MMMTLRASIVFLLLTTLTARAAEPPPFKQADAPRAFEFPRDHASHAGFQTEWWYVTGVVESDAGRKFGYQFTIFRRALDPRTPAEMGRTSAWAATDAYLGHAAVSDLTNKRYECAEILRRGALGVAGATDVAVVTGSASANVWIADWEFSRTAQGWRARANAAEFSLDLDLEETLPPTLHGKAGELGLSRKGPQMGQASYYYSVVRLKTRGTLTVHGQRHAIVKGSSWMDHEFGSNQLSHEQSGWDWFAIAFESGESLMLYRLRRKDGSIEAASSGTWIDREGRSTYLPNSAIQYAPGRTWTSARSGRTYPLEWRIEILGRGVELQLAALQDDQEFHSAKPDGFTYYEGAIGVKARVNGRTSAGEGYMEIAGSRGELGGKL